MSHGIEVDDNIMYAGEVPWHGLGTYVGDQDVTTEEAIKAANLDWNVRKTGVFNSNGDVVPGYFLLERDRDHKAFGIVRGRYKVLQNLQCFDFFDSISETGAVKIHTAGSLHGGRTVWMLAQVKGNIQVVDDDEVEKYILLHTRHDGMGAVSIKFTPVRVVCNNTLNFALNSGRKRSDTHVKISHMGDISLKIEEAKRIMGLIDSQFNIIQEAYIAMATTKLDVKNDFVKVFADNYFGVGKHKSDKEKELVASIYSDEFTQGVMDNYHSSSTLTNSNIEDTLWKGYNSITEYLDHKAPYTRKGAESRMNTLVFGARADMKISAFDFAKTLIQN